MAVLFFAPTTLPDPDTMNTINAILKRHPAILSLFVITPDEAVAHAQSHATLEPPPCPARHLNRFYHEAARLLPGSQEVSLSYGPTRVTLRPLPLNWVLAVHHRPGCDPTLFAALQKIARILPKTPRQLEEEAYTILTPDAVMAGVLAPWLIPLMKLLEKVTEAPPQAIFHQALNTWIDREDPTSGGLHRFAAIVTAAIADPAKQSRYAEKAKGILASGERAKKEEEMP